MRYAILATACLSLLLSVPVSAPAQVAKTAPKSKEKIRSFPNARKVESVMSEYLENLTEREELDLISRNDVAELFEELEDIGWFVSDHTEFEKRLLGDSDWLVGKLRTRQGTKFMRKIGQFPGGYAQLDLMRQSRQGKKEVSGIISTPGGEELIELLTTTKVGRNTSKKLAAQNRSKAKLIAERLYTKADIYKQLKVSYAAEAERRTKAAAIIARRAKTSKVSAPAKQPKPPKPTSTESSSSSEE